MLKSGVAAVLGQEKTALFPALLHGSIIALARASYCGRLIYRIPDSGLLQYWTLLLGFPPFLMALPLQGYLDISAVSKTVSLPCDALLCPGKKLLAFDLMQTTFQVFGVLLALITIWLDTRENVWARPLSLVGTGMALFVYYPAGLYAKCLLNLCYIVLNVYGWYQWLYGGKKRTPLQVSKTPTKVLAISASLGLLAAVGLGNLFALYSKASLPYWDSLHTVFCLIAQWMLMKKKLESWILWMLLDVLYAAVCYHQGLYLFSGLKVAYIFLAIQGYRSWRRSYLQQGPIV